MLESPCFHHPRGIEINTFWKSHTGCPNCHLPASKQKGLNGNKRLHFPTRRSKVRIHFGFQVPIAAAFCANPEPWPCPFIDISWHGLLLVRLDLWCSLHFIVGGCVCKLSKSIYDLTGLARQVHTQNEGLLEKKLFFYRGTIVLIKWTDHFRGFGSSRYNIYIYICENTCNSIKCMFHHPWHKTGGCQAWTPGRRTQDWWAPSVPSAPPRRPSPSEQAPPIPSTRCDDACRCSRRNLWRSRGPRGMGMGVGKAWKPDPKWRVSCHVNCKSLYLGVGTPWNPLYYGLWHKIWLGIPSLLNVEYPQRKPPWTVVDLFLNFDPWN